MGCPRRAKWPLDSRRFAQARLCVVVFIWVREGLLGRAYGSLLRTLSSFGYASVNLGATRGVRVQSGSRGFTWAPLITVGVITDRVGSHSDSPRRRLVHFRESVFFSGAHWGRRVHSGSRGITFALLTVAMFICVLVGH